jgi:Tfp pilus assembly protein PilO
MNTQSLLGLGGFMVATISAIVVPLFIVFFRMGRSAADLEAQGKEIEALKTRTEKHGHDLAGIASLRDLLDEVRADVKILLTKPARAQGPRDKEPST